jgi:hypothetical protein
MYLAQRRGRQRLALEAGKGFVDSRSELGFDDECDLGKGERLNAIVKATKRFEKRGRQQVGAAGEQLPQFDEGRPHAFEVIGQFFRET